MATTVESGTDRLNSITRDLNSRAEASEDPLTRAYQAVLLLLADKAATKFMEVTEEARTAAASWVPPTMDELVSKAEAADLLRQSTGAELRGVVEKMMLDLAGQTGVAGVDLDLRGFMVQHLLDIMGARTDDVIDGMRRTVANIVTDAWVNGWSMQETAAAIRTRVREISASEAQMLARTDLNALANGGSYFAARALYDVDPRAAPKWKRWLATPDERTRPTHVEAHGQTVLLTDTFEVGGAPMLYPGDPTGPDQEVINCRCTIVYADTKKELNALSADAVMATIKGLAAAYIEQEHPRDPGGEGGGRWIAKGTTGEDEKRGPVGTFKAVPELISRSVIDQQQASIEAARSEIENIPIPAEGASDSVYVKGGQFYRTSFGSWHWIGPMSGLFYRDTADEIIQLAHEQIADQEFVASKNWAARLRGKTYTDRNARPTMDAFRAGQAYNDTSQDWRTFADEFGADETPIILNADGMREMGKDVLTSAFYMPELDRVFVSGDLWKTSIEYRLSKGMSLDDLTGKVTPQTFSGGTTTSGLLRHEFGHQAWARFSPKQRSEFLARVPDHETLKGLSSYAAAAEELYNGEQWGGGIFPWQGEVFSEAVSATMDPQYDRREWPSWVNDMGDWIKMQRRET